MAGDGAPAGSPRQAPLHEYEPAAAPLFPREGRRLRPFARVRDVAQASATEVTCTLETFDGGLAHGRITFAAPDVVRFQWAVGRRPGRRRTEMLVDDVPELPLTLAGDGDAASISAGGPAARLDTARYRFSFGSFTTEPADSGLVDWVVHPGGWAEDDGGIAVYETFALRPGEEIYGLGERFVGPAMRGRRVAHRIDTALGASTTDKVHKSVPFLVSTRGYALFAQHPEQGAFDIGARSTASATVMMRSDELDLFVLLGDPKTVLRSYTSLTGRPSMPPAWSFRPWLSRCMYGSRAQVEEVVERARQEDFPVGVIGIDPLWMAGRRAWGHDACDFVVDEEAFGDMADLAEWLHDRDIRLCLWVNPHVSERSAAFVPERLIDGGQLREGLQPTRGFVDFTGVGGDWWLEELTKLRAMGVDAIKLDYGEMLTEGGTMADGRRTEDVRNIYPLMAAELIARAGFPVTITRGGTSGSQRHPVHWPGDTPATWTGLAGALRAGLAAAWSGFAFWTSDVGGFHLRDLVRGEEPGFGFSQPSAELYIRWVQFGMLCSHIRFHGNRPREPWVFGDEAVAVARRFAALRDQLTPYLLDCSAEAVAAGVPVMRPLALEFPDDPGSRHVDTEYLLGPDVLVCPVLEPDGRVHVYVPPGTWQEVFTGAVETGPAWVAPQRVPLDRIPVYVRAGSAPFGPGGDRQ